MPTPPPNAYAPGTVLTVGSHEATIEKYVSEGGFAHVYTCRTRPDLPGGVTGCLKRVAVPDKVYLALLRAEVDAMQRLRGQSNVVQYFDSHAERSRSGQGYEVFLLMEYCAGGGLIDYMNARLRVQLSEAEVLKIMFDITLGLAHMHYLQPPLIHRDLKIENVLLTAEGDWKLCDFGSVSPVLRPPKNAAEAHVLEDDIVHHTTAQYRSPEMIDVTRGFPIDEKCDIWALGVFLYKLCFYTTPFEQGGNAAILAGHYAIPARPAYSARLLNMIRVLLMPQPQQRPNVLQVMQELSSMRGVDCPLHEPPPYRTQAFENGAQHVAVVQSHPQQDLLRVRSREFNPNKQTAPSAPQPSIPQHLQSPPDLINVGPQVYNPSSGGPLQSSLATLSATDLTSASAPAVNVAQSSSASPTIMPSSAPPTVISSASSQTHNVQYNLSQGPSQDASPLLPTSPGLQLSPMLYASASQAVPSMSLPASVPAASEYMLSGPAPVSPGGISDISEREVAARFPTLDDFEHEAMQSKAVPPQVQPNTLSNTVAAAPQVPHPASKPSMSLRVQRLSLLPKPSSNVPQVKVQAPSSAPKAPVPASTKPALATPRPVPAIPSKQQLPPDSKAPEPRRLVQKLGQILTGLDAKSSTVVIEASSGHISSNVDFLRQLRDQNTGPHPNSGHPTGLHPHSHGGHANAQRRSSWFGGRRASKHTRQPSQSSSRAVSAGRRASMDVLRFTGGQSLDSDSNSDDILEPRRSRESMRSRAELPLDDSSSGRSLRSVESAPAFDIPSAQLSPQLFPTNSTSGAESGAGQADVRWRASFKPTNSIQQRVNAFLQGREPPARRTARGYGRFTDGDNLSVGSVSSRASGGSLSAESGSESIAESGTASEASNQPAVPSRRLKPTLGRIGSV